MGQGTRVETTWMGTASAEETPQRVQVKWDAGLGEGAVEDPIAEVAVEDTAVMVETLDDTNTIGLLPLWSVAALWVVAVILIAQGVKVTLKAIGLKDRLGSLRWKRWMFVVPIAVGMAMGYLLGPRVAGSFHFALDPVTSMFMLGFTSGASAPWVYMGFRHVVLPLLPATAIGLIERVTQIDLPDELKDKVTDSGLFNSPSEAVDISELTNGE